MDAVNSWWPLGGCSYFLVFLDGCCQCLALLGWMLVLLLAI